MTASLNVGEMELKNVAYGADVLQKMDIYLPDGRSTERTNVIVLIHGGGWVNGDKRDFDASIIYIKKHLPNYAIFNLNYRLATFTGANLWPTQINDINAAFNFISGKQNEYQVNTRKIVVIGASAGAHLAMLQAYKNNTGKQIKAVIDMFGPTDMSELYNGIAKFYPPTLLGVFMGGSPAANPASYLGASPLYFVNSQVPPTLIFHGAADNVVPIKQSDSLNSRLQIAGVKHQYIVYPNERHGWTGINLFDTHQKIIAFIKENVG